MEQKLSGMIIPAVTPFDKNGAVDFSRMELNFHKWNNTKVRGYMCLGSNGEFRSLNDQESLSVIKAASSYRAEGKTLIAGVGRESLNITLEFIDRLTKEAVMIDYISVLTPCYFASLMTDTALVDYYRKIADYSQYPVLLYCAPRFANSVCLSADAVRELADHPNIHGIKDTTSDRMKAYMEVAAKRDDFEVLAGSLGNLLTCLELGGKGGVVSAANYFPEQCVKVMELFEKDGVEKASLYLSELKRLASDTGGLAGVAGVKYSMDLAGYQGGYPRLPVMPVSEALKSKIKHAIEAESY